MRKHATSFVLKTTLAFLLLTAAGYAIIQSFTNSNDPIEIGAPAPNFTLTDRNGAEKQLSDYRGSVVLLNFWASWCNPCVNELPLLNESYKLLKMSGSDVEIVAVNVGEKESAVQTFIDRYDLEFPILLDDKNSVKKQYHVSSMPLTLLIDPSGVIVDIHEGELSDMADIFQLAHMAQSS